MASTIQTIFYATAGASIAPFLGVSPGLGGTAGAIADRIHSKVSHELAKTNNALDSSLADLVGVVTVITLTKASASTITTATSTVKDLVAFSGLTFLAFEGVKKAIHYISPGKQLNQTINHPVVGFGSRIALTALFTSIIRERLPLESDSATYITAGLALTTALGCLSYDIAQYLVSKPTSSLPETDATNKTLNTSGFSWLARQLIRVV